MSSIFKYFITIAILVYFAQTQTPKDNSQDQNNNQINLQSLLQWGTYKPHLMFALTERKINPITFGFLYYNPKDYLGFLDANKLAKFRLRYSVSRNIFCFYSYHNGFDYVNENIRDKQNNLQIQINFAKLAANKEHQSWVTQFYLTKLEQNIQNKPISQIFYIALESYDQIDNKLLTLVKSAKYSKTIKIYDQFIKQTKGYFHIDWSPINQKCKINKISLNFQENNQKTNYNIPQHLFSGNIQKRRRVFKLKNKFKSDQKQQNSNNSEQSQNRYTLVFINIISQGDCLVTVRFDNLKNPSILPQNILNNIFLLKRKNFSQKIESSFLKNNSNISKSLTHFTMNAVSSILGGITFYYGTIKGTNNFGMQQPKGMFTCTPSRLGFPKGFVWDEGFHQMILCRWSTVLCAHIIEFYFDTMDITGWIPREQNRGIEVELLTVEGFIEQDGLEANPPTLLLPLNFLFDKYYQKEKGIQEFIKRIYPKLQQWFAWYLRTQTQFNTESIDGFENMVWYCKGQCPNNLFFASGLDDYPRNDFFSLSRRHIDLISWLIFFLKQLIKFGQELEYDVTEYKKLQLNLQNQLYFTNLDPDSNLFKDIYQDKFTFIHKFSSHLGYVNLFPLIFGIVKSGSSEWMQTLKLITDRDHLWSDFGIRSLSMQDSLFGKGDDYWRGNIWININYLILRSLKLYYWADDDAKRVYKDLKSNVIKNVVQNWQQTGYFWETYHGVTGVGKRQPYFSGWTALVSLIIGDQY